MEGDETNGTDAEPLRPSADEMDESRYQQMAHEYLCRLREARDWIQACLSDELPPLIEFEDSMRNGVVLARLANYVAPKVVRTKDIFDSDQTHYREVGLRFRHTDNVSRFLKMAEVMGLPKVFYPEIVDIYDKKNMPKAIYCIHALSIYLRKRFGNKYPTLQDVSGTARFTEEEISAMAKELAKYGITIPAFGKIGGLLTNEMPIDQVALHAAIIAINQLIDKGDAHATLPALQNPNAHLVNVQVENADYYQQNLRNAKKGKEAPANTNGTLELNEDANELYSHFLTKEEIQLCIEETNTDTLLDEVANAVAAEDSVRLLKLLRHPTFGVADYLEDQPDYYLQLLQKALLNKAAEKGDSMKFQKDQIYELIVRGHRPLKETVEKGKLIIGINDAIDSRADKVEVLRLLHALEEFEPIGQVADAHGGLYVNNLAVARRAKPSDHHSEWLYTSVEGIPLRMDAKTGHLSSAGDATAVSPYLTSDDIKVIIQKSNAQWNAERIRKEDEAAKKIQGAWRDHHVTQTRISKARDDAESAKKREDAARRIQSFYRTHKPQHDYRRLKTHPDLHVVQKFVSLLNETDIDYEEELEIERLRKAIRQEIQQHKKYEKQLDDLDIQIGLLVRNRINLEKTLKQSEARNRRHSGGSKRSSVVDFNGDVKSFGFDSLTKTGRQRLHAYQNLLYLLSRNPKYLAQLLIGKIPPDSDEFTDDVILPLFSYGTGLYDEYLLLSLFTTAMDDELDRKVPNLGSTQTTDLVSAEQLLKFINNSYGDQYTREVLQNLLTSLLALKSSLDTNPVVLYQHWIYELEANTGKSSGLPFEITPEAALVHPEVKEKLSQSIIALKRWVADFLDAITGSADKLPYALRYACKALRLKLATKFSQEPPKAILKMTADVLFYRFIHACVVPPEERGDIIGDDERTKRQRQTASNVAMLLHFIMINKGYNEEHPHLIEFNSFIKECHQKFKIFFNTMCDVPNLEEHFQVDEYVDYVTVARPSVVIRLGELIKLHELLLDSRDEIAKDLVDPLHELLNDFGPGRPSIFDVVGEIDEATWRRAESADLVLTLTNKFEPVGPKDGLRHEFLTTKKYLVDIMLCQRAGSVVNLIQLPVTEEDEKKHQTVLNSRYKHEQELSQRMTLKQKKAAALTSLSTLEEAGLVSRKNDYSEILASIAQDIRTRWRYREGRTKERTRLSAILEKLNRKSLVYREQIEYYDLYLKACLNSMPAQSKKRDSLKRGSMDKVQAPKTVKYSAHELAEKGVLLGIDDAPRNAFKSINFEIKNTSTPGVFEITSKNMEPEEVVLQDLLQLQFENVHTATLFGKAQVNVDALINLLNKKFFAKSK